MCEHRWVYQMSDYTQEKVGYYSYKYARIDTYYCEKCCEIKEKIAKMETKDITNGLPAWYR